MAEHSRSSWRSAEPSSRSPTAAPADVVIGGEADPYMRRWG